MERLFRCIKKQTCYKSTILYINTFFPFALSVRALALGATIGEVSRIEIEISRLRCTMLEMEEPHSHERGSLY